MKRFIATLPAIFLSSCVMANGLNNTMNEVFNSMVNTTTPDAYNSARRGVISGGNLFVRNPTKNVDLASMTAPSFSAGCGGIDLYGGSFSFINADQMVETFQAIGANALTYGIKLAIQDACDSCENVMTSLEKTAQFINKMNVDSCQAAQGIVNAGIDFATGAQAEVNASTFGVSSGLFDDFSDAWSSPSSSGKSSSQQIKNANPDYYAEHITGNVVWRSLKQQNVQSLFSGGNHDFLMLLMSMTGTVVINDVGTDDEASPQPQLIPGGTVTMEQLLNDSQVKVMECTDGTDVNECLNVKMASKTIAYTPMIERFRELLAGRNGLVTALQGDSDWSDEARAMVGIDTLSGQACLRTIYQMSSIGSQGAPVAGYIAEICSSRMALEATKATLDALYSTTYQAVSQSIDSQKEVTLSHLDGEREKMEQEFNRLDKAIPVDALLSRLDTINRLYEGARPTLNRQEF